MLRARVVRARPCLWLCLLAAYGGLSTVMLRFASVMQLSSPRQNESRKNASLSLKAAPDGIAVGDSSGSCCCRPSGELGASGRFRATDAETGAGAPRTGLSPKSIFRRPSGYALPFRGAAARLASLLLHPTEPPFVGTPEIDWIESALTPTATILGFHWLIWFFAISAVTARWHCGANSAPHSDAFSFFSAADRRHSVCPVY